MNPKDKQVISHVASNILNTFNIEQIFQICRDFAYIKAEAYYESLSAEDKKKLEEKVKDVIDSQQETQPS